MSAPARELSTPRRAPSHKPSAPRPSARPSAKRVVVRPVKAAPRLGFIVFSGAVLAALIVGVVVLSAFLAQTSFQIRSTRDRISVLAERYQTLTDQAARLSSPSRVASWASKHEMVVPAQVHILRVPGTAAESGSTSEVRDDGPGALALAVKPILGDNG